MAPLYLGDGRLPVVVLAMWIVVPTSTEVSSGIKFAIILTLLYDFWPIFLRQVKVLISDRSNVLRPYYEHPVTRVMDVETIIDREEVNNDFVIKGYKNASLIQRWGRATYDMSWKISIHIFAWRREKSLRRLCESLLRAQYFGYEIPLYFHVDGEPLGLVTHYVNEFKWPHGPKIVNMRKERLGMPAAILSGWAPKSEEEYAILLEDDIEVAVGFFEFSLYCLSIQTYKRMVEGENHGMLGCSLYTPRVNEIGPAPNAWSPPTWNPTHVIGPRHRLLYFQLPCSWGAIYHAKYWLEFLRYYSIRQQVGGRVEGEHFPLIPKSRSNEWFQSWKRTLIELMLFKGWYLLYPSFLGQASFSTNYFEKGVHSVAEGQVASIPNEIRKSGDRRFTVPLHQDFSFRVSLPTPSIGMIRRIPYLNLYHERVNSRRDLILDVKPFLEAAKVPELYHFFGKETLSEDFRDKETAWLAVIPGNSTSTLLEDVNEGDDEGDNQDDNGLAGNDHHHNKEFL